MSSKEIIIKLIDEKLISGEEAYVLINDVIQGELTDAWRILNSNPHPTYLTSDISATTIGSSYSVSK